MGARSVKADLNPNTRPVHASERHPLRRFLSWTLLALLLGGAALTAAFWAPDPTVAELSARWAPPPPRFIAIEGMQVHLRDEGPRDDPSRSC